MINDSHGASRANSLVLRFLNLKNTEFKRNGYGMCLALSVSHWVIGNGKQERGGTMVRMIKKVGDRELAWAMLAVAAVALWSTWGLTS